MRKNMKLYINILYSALIFLSLLLTTFMAVDSSYPPEYEFLFLLPGLYSIVLLLFRTLLPIESHKNIGVILFLTQSFIRCVLTPLLMMLGSYKSLFIDLTSNNVVSSIFLLIYEQITCCFAIILSYRITRRQNRGMTKVFSLSVFGIVTLSFVVVCLVLWFAFPSIRDNYISIFDFVGQKTKFSSTDYQSVYAIGDSTRIATTLFIVLFKFVRILLPAFLICLLSKRNEKKMAFILSILIILSQFLIIPDTLASPIINSILLSILVYNLFKKYRKFLIAFSFLIVGVGTFFVVNIIFSQFAIWYDAQNIWELLSRLILSYFSGVSNIASVYRMEHVNKISSLYDTLLSCIPFNSSLGLNVGKNDLNTIYTSTSGLNGQILATIGGGFYIFGPIFAPVFSFCFMYISSRNGIRFKQAKNPFSKIKYLYLTIITALGLGFYGVQIVLSNIMQIAIPLFIISAVSSYQHNYQNSTALVRDNAFASCSRSSRENG